MLDGAWPLMHREGAVIGMEYFNVSQRDWEIRGHSPAKFERLCDCIENIIVQRTTLYTSFTMNLHSAPFLCRFPASQPL